MKKLLSLLSVLTVGTVATTNVVACSNKNQLTPADQSKLPFLYHVAQVTNLGTVKKDADSILTAFKKVNPSIKDNTLKITNITDKNAVINVDQYDTNFKKGTLKVTFNTVDSNDLNKLITIKNVYANRHVNGFDDIPTVKDQDVIDGINAANGLSLNTQDVTISYKGKHNPFSGTSIFKPDSSSLIATVTSNSKKYTGTVTVNLNKNLDLNETFSNTDIGTIFLPAAAIKNLTNPDPTYQLVIKAMLVESIGDANPLFAYYKDVIANLQFSTSKTALTFDKTHLTLDAKDIKDNPLSEYFKNSVTFNFTIEKDNRLKINDAVKTTDLGVLKNADLDTIKDSIIDKNQLQLKQYDKNEIKRYLVVTVNEDNKTATVSWLPGSKQFLGHDPLAMSFAPDDIKAEVGKLDTTVNFTINK